MANRKINLSPFLFVELVAGGVVELENSKMRNWKIRLTPFLLATLIVSMNACADGPSAASLDPKAHIADVLKGVKLEQQKLAQPHDPLCAQFLEDFKQQKNIEYIEPIVQTDDYDDPKLKPYRDRCPNLVLNRRLAFSHRISLEEIDELSDEEKEGFAVEISYGTKNFKLFKVDIDNDAKNGEEYLFYDQAYKSVKPKQYAGKISDPDAGGYIVIDFANCRTRGGATSGGRTTSDYRMAFYHGPIKHRGKNHVYVLEMERGRQGSLLLYSFLEKTLTGKPGLGQSCVYRASPEPAINN